MSLHDISHIFINKHSVFELLGVVLGALVLRFSARSQKTPSIDEKSDNRFVFICMLVGAIIGSRLLAMLEALLIDLPLRHLLERKTIIGGIIGGIIATEMAKKWRGLTQSRGDRLVLPLMVSISVGRIGCLWSGVQDHTWGKAISDDNFLYMYFSHHPIPLYEIVFLQTALLVVVLAKNRIMFADGVLFRVFICSYFLFRAAMECIKPFFPTWFFFTPVQIACIAMTIIYLYSLRARAKLPTEIVDAE